MRRTILCCLILIFGVSTLAAKDIDGEFVVFSIGAASCSDYLQARRNESTSIESYRQWLSGYLSAFNLIVVNTYDIVGDYKYKQIIDWLDRYCLQNQTVTFVNASAALTISLYPDRRNLAPNKDTSNKWLGSGNLFSVENSTTQ